MKTEISLPKLQQDTQNALKSWYEPDPDISPFDWLQIFHQTRSQGVSTNREATNKLLLNALEALEMKRKDDADLLRRYFLDGEKMQIIARSRNISEATIYSAVNQLAFILQTQEIQAREQKLAALAERLESPTYTELIGIEEHLDHLLEVITSPEPPWLISVEGLGGIGKTSLADALSRQAITRQLFVDFAWVSARRQILNLRGGLKSVDFPALTTENLLDRLVVQLMPDTSGRLEFSIQEATAALKRKLKQGLHLIVIDNLETVIDLETLLPLLRELSNPTKFLLTSRESLHDDPTVYPFSLPELSEANTLRFIRHEARLRNIPPLQRANDDDLKRIFKVVGGNPLAIRLVVGQANAYTLDDILKGLTAAQGQKVEMLYEHIYYQSWLALDEVARQVLLAMPLVTEQRGTLEYLSRLSEIEASDLRTALEWLIALNLVDSKGNLDDRFYTIHNLTRTFLQEQVLKWQ